MRVLVAEDDTVSRRILEITLKQWNYDLVAVRDGQDALSELAKPGGPEIAILDVMMPLIDGLDVTRRIRELRPSNELYILLLTSKGRKEDILAGFSAGADDYLTKPFDRDELRARLEVGARLIGLQQTLAHRVDELRISEERYRHLVEYSQGLIWTHNEKRRILYVNPAAARRLGYTTEELVGKNISDIVVTPPEKLPDNVSPAERASIQRSIGLRSRHGEERVWLYQSVPLYDAEGKLLYFLCHAQDVTELKRAEAALRNLALSDELTHLYNRRGFLAFAQEAVETAGRAGKDMTLLYGDMDGLKAINDTLGHDAGSEAICEVADVLRQSFRRSSFRPPDILARFGGDEFVVLAADDGRAGLSEARVAENLRIANAAAGRRYSLGLSLGSVPVLAGHQIDLEDLVKRADALMYEKKRAKKATSVRAAE